MVLYIDPGTGSMLITILIGLLGTGIYFIRSLFIKLKYISKKGNIDDLDEGYTLVIFSDDKRYWNVFRPICKELNNRNISAVYMTESEDDPAFKEDFENIKVINIGHGNIAYAKLNNLKADVILSTTPSLDVFQWKRSKNVKNYIHITHMPSDITMYKMFGIDYYDAILLSGEYQCEQVRKLEELRNLPQKKLEIVGLPYLDELIKKYEKYKDNNPLVSDTIKVLLAPSWGPNGILSKYGSEFIDKLIETGLSVIIRPHPQSFVSEKQMIDDLMKKYSEKDNVIWNRDNDNFDVMCESDILISDFSGIIFEYSLVFDKPIIYTAPDYDKSTYDCAWIDDELWTFKTLKSIGKELTIDNFDNIGSIIKEVLSGDSYEEGRKIAREETWMYQGEGTKRVVDFIEQEMNQ